MLIGELGAAVRLPSQTIRFYERAGMSELAVLAAELDQLRDRSRRLDPADCSDAAICRVFAASTQPGPVDVGQA